MIVWYNYHSSIDVVSYDGHFLLLSHSQDVQQMLSGVD